MCDPVTATAITLTALQGGAKAYSQKQQQDALEENYKKRQEQEEAAAAQKALERSRQARRERSKMAAQSAISGVEGSSVSQQYMDSRFQEGYDKQSIETNTEWRMEGNRTSANTRAAKIGSPAMTGVQTGLQIGTTYANSQMTDSMKKTTGTNGRA